MTDNQPTDRPEAFPGGAAPDSGGSPLGDLYGAGGAAATPATATPGSGATTPTSTTGTPPRAAGSAGSRSHGTGSSGSGSSGTGEAVKEEAQHVRDTAKDAGRQVAGTAKDEAQHVAGEAKAQARQLFDQTMHEAREQAKSQQHRAADGMHTFGEDLRGMADGAQSGLAAQLVREVSDRATGAARWLEEREPADLLDELKSFARRRPGTFIAIAGVAGLVVGRLTRGMISGAKEEHERSGAGGGGAHAGSTMPTTASGATATPVPVASPYGDSAMPSGAPGTDPVVPGGSTRATRVDADLPAQTGHSPSGTGLPTRREDGL